MSQFPPVPQEVKPIAHLLKLADEHEGRNIIVTYWARMGACLMGLRICPGKKSPETAELIRKLLDWLEVTKKANADNEGIANETAAQAMIEEYALKMFEKADELDRQEIFNKNTVKLFYTSGMLMDVLDQFGALEDEIKEKRKYAKWKAAYIHNCLKHGERPIPGPPTILNDESALLDTSKATEDELKGYTKYEVKPEDMNTFNQMFYRQISDPNAPAESTDNLFPSGPPKPDDGSAFSHAPASSPITPILPPSQPTPFNTPSQVPVQPAPVVNPTPTPRTPPNSSSTSTGFAPTPEQIQKAQKYSKYATSALNYDDVKNAMDYLQKAMNLLTTGKEE